MGFASIAGMVILFLVVSMLVGGFFVVQAKLLEKEEAITEKQDRLLKMLESEISITGEQYNNPMYIPWVLTLKTDFDRGTNFTNIDTNTTPGSIQTVWNGTDYNNSATYYSEVYDINISSNFSKIYWNATLPVGTSVRFQLRSGNTSTQIENADFIGPDGPLDYYTSSGEEINITHNESSMIQLKIDLETVDTQETAKVDQVNITIMRQSPHIYLTLSNDGTTTYDFEKVDVYVGSERIKRNDSDRVEFITNDDLQPTLWSPGEIIDLYIFETLGGNTIVKAVTEFENSATITVTP